MDFQRVTQIYRITFSCGSTISGQCSAKRHLSDIVLHNYEEAPELQSIHERRKENKHFIGVFATTRFDIHRQSLIRLILQDLSKAMDPSDQIT